MNTPTNIFSPRPSVPQRLGAPSQPHPRRAFTFTEVMFAVVILGVGFIMLAAMFPVAIKMNQQSSEETLAVTAAQKTLKSLQSNATNTLFPPTSGTTATSVSVTNPAAPVFIAPYVALGEASTNVTAIQAAAQFVTFRGDLVCSLDKTIGVALAYSRNGPVTFTGDYTDNAATSDTMRVIAVVAKARERSTFNNEDSNPAKCGKDVTIPGTTNITLSAQCVSVGEHPATLQFKRFNALISPGSNGAPDTIQFTSFVTGDIPAAGPGAYVIIANDGTNAGTSNGQVLRLGDAAAGSPDTYQLVSGQDYSSLAPSVRPPATSVEVLVLGRALQDPTQSYDSTNNPYTGATMDIAVYTSLVGIRN